LPVKIHNISPVCDFKAARDERQGTSEKKIYLVPFIKIFPDAEQANQKPEKFDDKGGIQVRSEK
jgi:hypothetical protein